MNRSSPKWYQNDHNNFTYENTRADPLIWRRTPPFSVLITEGAVKTFSACRRCLLPTFPEGSTVRTRKRRRKQHVIQPRKPR